MDGSVNGRKPQSAKAEKKAATDRRIEEYEYLSITNKYKVEQCLRRAFYGGQNYTTASLRAFVLEETGIDCSTERISSTLKRIQKEDAEEELARQGFSKDRIRGEHRKRREMILDLSLQLENPNAANTAADKLMVLDGIAPELLKVEKTVQQMSDPELLKFVEKLLDTATITLLASAMMQSHIELLYRTLNEDQRAILRDCQRDAVEERTGTVRYLPPGDPETQRIGDGGGMDDDL